MASGSYDEGDSKGENIQSTNTLSISELRELAQSHLQTIETEVNSEAEAQIQAQAVLQKYTKMKRKDRQRSRSPSQAALASSVFAAVAASGSYGVADMIKGPKLRSAEDVLARLKWDPSVDMNEYFIGYLERFDGILEMPAANWIKESTDEDFIPQHRIRWVKRRTESNEEVVWDREHRIDKIFGSGVQQPDRATVADIESVTDSAGGGAPL